MGSKEQYGKDFAPSMAHHREIVKINKKDHGTSSSKIVCNFVESAEVRVVF